MSVSGSWDGFVHRYALQRRKRRLWEYEGHVPSGEHHIVFFVDGNRYLNPWLPHTVDSQNMPVNILTV